MKPTQVLYPPNNAYEWSQSIYTTGAVAVPVVKLNSYDIFSMSPALTKLVEQSQLDLNAVDSMMLDKVQNSLTREQAACAWLKNNEARWKATWLSRVQCEILKLQRRYLIHCYSQVKASLEGALFGFTTFHVYPPLASSRNYMASTYTHYIVRMYKHKCKGKHTCNKTNARLSCNFGGNSWNQGISVELKEARKESNRSNLREERVKETAKLWRPSKAWVLSCRTLLSVWSTTLTIRIPNVLTALMSQCVRQFRSI